MDPLSVTASILTILATAGTLLKALEQVRSRLNPNAELLLIMNMVTDLQATLIVARDCANELKSNTVPTASQSYTELYESVHRLQESLNRLVDFARTKLLRNRKGLPLLSLTDRKKRKLLELRESITGAHRNLQTILLSANLRITPTLYSSIQEAMVIENDHYVKTSAELKHIVTQITSMQNINQYRLTNNDSTDYEHNVQSSVVRTSIVQQAISEANTSLASQQVRITTSVPLKQCKPCCVCQCHVRTQYRTPQWISAVVGTLFYSSTNTPALEARPCNSKQCYRLRSSSSMHLTYHFPVWMIRTAFVYSAWNNLEGTNSSWMLRMPRVFPEGNDCMCHILEGHVDHVKQLLGRKEVSPWDINARGSTLLMRAIQWSQLDICALLVVAGADWQQKDRYGRCAADVAWRTILASRNTDPEAIRLRELIRSEDDYDLHLSSIHRIIVGLSSADLQEQLHLDPSLIDRGDWTGMSPLMWAAIRADSITVQVLLSYSVNIHAENMDGSALHYAVLSGSYDCVRLLLEAGANPNAYDQNYNTPIYRAVQLRLPRSRIEKIVSILADYGADLDVCDKKRLTPMLWATLCRNPNGIETLINCGCDPNTFMSGFQTALALAVSFNYHECITKLLELGAQLSWTQNTEDCVNIFPWLAAYATMDTINILASSEAPVVPYDRAEAMACFRNRISTNVYQRIGQSISPSEEVELAAWENLLAKKGIEIKPGMMESRDKLGQLAEEDETDIEDPEIFGDAVSYFHNHD